MPPGQRDHPVRVISVVFVTFCWVAPFSGGSAQQREPTPPVVGAPVATSFVDHLGLISRFKQGVLRLEAMGDSAPRAPVGSPARAPNRACTDHTERTALNYGPFAPEAVGARSGEFTVPLQNYGKPSFKLGWVPLVADTSAVLTITAYRLDSAVAPVRFEQRFMARSGGRGMLRSSGGGRFFYATHPALPRRGVWALVGQAGVSWGCFIVQL
jgi:hypothetical protein